jgi:hypothetical protein
MCSTIPADLSRVANRNGRLCGTLFDERPEQSDWHLESMQFGMDLEMLMIATTDGNI